MTTETRILSLHPWPFPALDSVRAAKAALDLPFLVKPQPARPGAKRILATQVPGWACDYAIVRGDDPESFRWALLWVLGEVEYDARATNVSSWLSAQFGAEVRELMPEPLEQKVSFV